MATVVHPHAHDVFDEPASDTERANSATTGLRIIVGKVKMTYSMFRDRDALAATCRRYDIRRLSLFGSTLKGSDRPESDVDLLVEFEPDARPSLLTMARIEIELSSLLGGRKVDLRTAQDLSRYFREEVVRAAETQYEAR